jgi:hypothetical protein
MFRNCSPNTERLDEVAEILAAGLARLCHRQQSSCSVPEKVGLDFPPDQSVHANHSQEGGACGKGER